MGANMDTVRAIDAAFAERDLLERAAAACLTSLCDIQHGYRDRELHEPVSVTITRLRDLLRARGIDDEGAWD